MLGFKGPTLPEHVRRWLAEGLGGIFLFPPNDNLRSKTQVRELTDAIHAANPNALVAIDEEGGRVQAWGPPHSKTWPTARELGRSGADACEQTGREIGQELAELGIDVNFAPVVDVDTCASNPIIGDRAFATEPQAVIAHARAFIRGLTSCAILPCIKHFPGHGETDRDSHLELPTVTDDRAVLMRRELVPFAALLAEVPLVMTAHVVYTGLDPHNPATHSPAILGDLLRGELGFTGLVISDDMAMKGIRQELALVDACLRALNAGCDMVLSAFETDEHPALIDALRLPA